MRFLFPKVSKHYIHLFIIAITFCLINGCMSIRQMPKILDEDVPNVHIAYQVDEMQIVDNRKNVSDGEMKIPTWSTPKSYNRHSPGLTSAHKQEIGQFFENNVKGTGPSVQAIVTLKEAYKEFSATAGRERERGHVSMEITLYDIASQKELISCESMSDFGVESIDANQERMEKVYRYTLRQAIYKCFKSMGSVQEDVGGE